MMKKILCTLGILVILGLQSQGQINVNNNANATNLAQRLVGTGVSVTNATLNCPPLASGDFTVTSSNLGLDSGIVLTTGTADSTSPTTGINGPALGPSTGHQAPGDPDLSILCGQQTEDACILEFDFETVGDSIKFDYVFGSSEYPNFTCSNFNDVFGFFVSGPGIAGPYSNGAINIALVPGSTTCPVGVSTIYCPNMPGCCNTTNTNCFGLTAGCGMFNATNNTCNYFVCNANGTTVNYQGFTTVLTAQAEVIPCSTYHFKLAIADAFDDILDSGIMLESGSFSSNQIDVKLDAGLTNASGQRYIIEGCDTAKLTIKVKKSVSNPVADTIRFDVLGNAQNGIDYTPIPDSIVFAANPNDTIQTINIFAFNDGISEGTELIKIHVRAGCHNNIVDSITIEIRDSLDFDLYTPDTAICLGDMVSIRGQADSGLALLWTPTIGVSPPNQLQCNIIPTNIGVTTYNVTASYKTCPPATKSIKITTDPVPTITPLPDIELCQGDTAQISASVSPNFTYTINWSGSPDLYNTGGLTPYLIGNSTSNIILTVSSSNARCTAKDTFTATVHAAPQGSIIPDTIVCDGQPVQLWATSNLNNYAWSPGTNLSCTNCPDPIYTGLGGQRFRVVLLGVSGCNDTLYTNVETHPPFTLKLHNNDTIINAGDIVRLKATGAHYYAWTPNVYLTYPASGSTVSKPFEDITYTVMGLSEYQGCPQYDSVKITVVERNVFVPNAFSPNGDGNNDVFKVVFNSLIALEDFSVYNRWGQQIFSTKDEYKGWDGTYKGVAQPLGTYFYLIRLSHPSGKHEVLKGSVHLLR